MVNTRSVVTASSISRRSAAWTNWRDWMVGSRRFVPRSCTLSGIKILAMVFYSRLDHRHSEEVIMKTRYTVALSVLAGAALGAAAIQGLHAQAKPPAYAVAEVDISNQEAFVKKFLPLATEALATGAGYKVLSREPKTIPINAPAPKSLIPITH